MFNKRWKKVLAWSLSVIIVLAIGGLFAANYAVDRLMTSMAEGIDLEAVNVPNNEVVEGETSLATAVPTTAVATSNPDATSTVDEGNDGTESVESPRPENTPSTVKENSGSTTNKDWNSDNKSTDPVASSSNEKENNYDEYSAQVSTDKAKHIQENVTVTEKANVASIIMGQLSMSDIKRLQELASGGLTIEDKREARSIILGKVSEDQYNELSQIAKKYGVSEGKTQAQVIAEEKASEEGSEQ